MTFKRLRRLGAGAAIALLVPGGATPALAESEPTTKATSVSATDQSARTSARSRQRVEDAWIAEQVHAELRSRAAH
jgi:hypothetical protein